MVPNRKKQSEVYGRPTESFPNRRQGSLQQTSAKKVGVFDFKQRLCLRNPIVLAVTEFSTDETIKEVVTSRLSKDLDEQLKHVQKDITIVDRPKRKINATMKKYNIDKPENTYVELRLFARNSEHDNFQQLVFVSYNFDESLYLLDSITSLSDQLLSN